MLGSSRASPPPGSAGSLFPAGEEDAAEERDQEWHERTLMARLDASSPSPPMPALSDEAADAADEEDEQAPTPMSEEARRLEAEARQRIQEARAANEINRARARAQAQASGAGAKGEGVAKRPSRPGDLSSFSFLDAPRPRGSQTAASSGKARPGASRAALDTDGSDSDMDVAALLANPALVAKQAKARGKGAKQQVESTPIWRPKLQPAETNVAGQKRASAATDVPDDPFALDLEAETQALAHKGAAKKKQKVSVSSSGQRVHVLSDSDAEDDDSEWAAAPTAAPAHRRRPSVSSSGAACITLSSDDENDMERRARARPTPAPAGRKGAAASSAAAAASSSGAAAVSVDSSDDSDPEGVDLATMNPAAADILRSITANRHSNMQLKRKLAESAKAAKVEAAALPILPVPPSSLSHLRTPPATAADQAVAAAHAAASSAFQARPTPRSHPAAAPPPPAATVPASPAASASPAAPAAVAPAAAAAAPTIHLNLAGLSAAGKMKRFKVFTSTRFSDVIRKVREMRPAAAGVRLTWKERNVEPEDTPEAMGMQQDDVVQCTFL